MQTQSRLFFDQHGKQKQHNNIAPDDDDPSSERRTLSVSKLIPADVR